MNRIAHAVTPMHASTTRPGGSEPALAKGELPESVESLVSFNHASSAYGRSEGLVESLRRSEIRSSTGDSPLRRWSQRPSQEGDHRGVHWGFIGPVDVSQGGEHHGA